MTTTVMCLFARARNGAYLMPILLIALSLLMTYIPSVAQGGQGVPTGGAPLDLRKLPLEGVFVFYDTPAEASQTGKPLDIGDFDGDGCGDIAITGQNASHSVGGVWRRVVGHVRILMNRCPIAGRVALEEAPASPDEGLFTIFGAYPGDMAGTETYVADFNGDGYDDLLLGAQNADGPDLSRPNAGAAYVVFGGPGFAAHPDIDLREPTDDVLTLHGAEADDRLGLWVAGGDFDGDGYGDLLISANQADGQENRRINAGEAWIIYGREDLIAAYGAVIDMRQPPADATRIIGADFDDLLGSCAAGGDLNGDGVDDAIVSAALWRGSAGVGGLSFGGGDGPENTRYNSGDVYVVFGGPDLRGETVDLAFRVGESGAPLDDSVAVIYGAEANDLLGEEIAVGDLNGDGQNELILGTLIGDGPDNTLEDSGEAWVIDVGEGFAGRMIDLAAPTVPVVIIYPDQPFSKGGDTVRVADVDGDGLGDLLYGAPDYDATGYDGVPRSGAGMLAVLYGQAGGLPNMDGAIVLPSGAPDGLRVGYVVGADENDMMAYALAATDVDGDGLADLAPNAMGGDGADNGHFNAGEIYLISGAAFSAPGRELAEGPLPAPTGVAAPTTPTTLPPTVTPAPLPTFTVDTGQPGDVDAGRRRYREGCAGCHGFAGEGSGVGVSLVESAYLAAIADEDLLRFLMVGRSSDDPASLTGMSMPAYGGRADWGDAELWDIVAYLRYLVSRQRE